VSSINIFGRTVNFATSATTAGVRVNVRQCAGVAFVLIGATSGNATISEANAASGGTSQNLAAITEYWTQASGVWTRVTQAAAATFTAATGGLAVAWVPQGALSDTFSYLSASHASGSFVYVLGDLTAGRFPQNLPAVTA
jgi:hypothetical protein